MEIWVVACIVFIFGALVEYAFLLLQIKINTFKGTKKTEAKAIGKKAFVDKDEEDGESEEEKEGGGGKRGSGSGRY